MVDKIDKESATISDRTVLVVDDHELVRSGIKNALAKIPDVRVVAEAANGIEAMSLLKQHRPSFITLDLAMPVANGIEVLEEARRFSPETKVIILTGSTHHALVQQAIEGGADGLLLKMDDGTELLNAVPKILNGERVISARINQRGCNSTAALTRREAQILQAIARGESNKALAKRLNISPTTVNNHRANIMRKFDVHSAAELISLAVREGLVDTSV